MVSLSCNDAMQSGNVLVEYVLAGSRDTDPRALTAIRCSFARLNQSGFRHRRQVLGHNRVARPGYFLQLRELNILRLGQNCHHLKPGGCLQKGTKAD